MGRREAAAGRLHALGMDRYRYLPSCPSYGILSSKICFPMCLQDVKNATARTCVQSVTFPYPLYVRWQSTHSPFAYFGMRHAEVTQEEDIHVYYVAIVGKVARPRGMVHRNPRINLAQ